MHRIITIIIAITFSLSISALGLTYQFGGSYFAVTPEAYRPPHSVQVSVQYFPTFHYYVPDYQGNVRLVVDGNGTIEQRNDYYAYGGPWGDNAINQGFQPNKYNGKELDRVHGLDWYDYGARMYDPAMGLFTQVDPLAEQYPHLNPYQYCAGNPVKYVDPDGKSIWTKLIKGSLKVGKQVAKTGVKALGETATYATAVADIVDDVSVLTDSEAPTGERIWAGVSLASEFLPVSINDAKDVGKALKHADLDNTSEFGKTTKTIARPKSINQLQRDVERGRAPKAIDRFDPANEGKHVKDHVHFKNEKSALNKDGSWKDGPPIHISRKIKDYLIQNGWIIE